MGLGCTSASSESQVSLGLKSQNWKCVSRADVDYRKSLYFQ